LVQLHNNDMPMQFPELGGRLVLHIVPFSAFGSETVLDPKAMEREELPPLWSRGYKRGYNVEGYLTTYEGGRASSYLQVFRNGIIETVAGDVREPYAIGTLRLRAMHVESEVIQRVSSSMTALSRAEVQTPMLIMLGGVRMDGTMVVGPVDGFAPPSPPSLLRKSELHLPAVTIEGYGEMSDYARALKQVFDALWNAADYGGSRSYDATGNWKPHQ
jgi:hypothetical protein